MDTLYLDYQSLDTTGALTTMVAKGLVVVANVFEGSSSRC